MGTFKAIVVLLLLDILTAQVFHVEMPASWAEADDSCGRQGVSLLPGRSYKKTELVKTLADGQTLWVRGWRVVTDKQPDAKGKIPFLKVEFVPNYTFATSYFICRDGDGIMEISPKKPITQPDAEAECVQNYQILAPIDSADDVRAIINVIGYGSSHWTGPIQSQGRFAKQCLTARRLGREIVYAYDECSIPHNFICLQDVYSSSRLAPIVVRKSMLFADIEDEINWIALMPAPTSSITIIYSSLTPNVSAAILSKSSFNQSSYTTPPLSTSFVYTSANIHDITSSSTLQVSTPLYNDTLSEYSALSSAASSSYFARAPPHSAISDTSSDSTLLTSTTYASTQPATPGLSTRFSNNTEKPYNILSMNATSVSSTGISVSVYHEPPTSISHIESSVTSTTHVHSIVSIRTSSTQTFTCNTEAISASISSVDLRTSSSIGDTVTSSSIQKHTYDTVPNMFNLSTSSLHGSIPSTINTSPDASGHIPTMPNLITNVHESLDRSSNANTSIHVQHVAETSTSIHVSMSTTTSSQEKIFEDSLTAITASSSIVSHDYITTSMNIKQSSSEYKTVTHITVSKMDNSIKQMVSTGSPNVYHTEESKISQPVRANNTANYYDKSVAFSLDSSIRSTSLRHANTDVYSPSMILPEITHSSATKSASVTAQHTLYPTLSSMTLPSSSYEYDKTDTTIIPSDEITYNYITTTPPLVLNTSKLTLDSDQTSLVLSTASTNSHWNISDTTQERSMVTPIVVYNKGVLPSKYFNIKSTRTSSMTILTSRQWVFPTSIFNTFHSASTPVYASTPTDVSPSTIDDTDTDNDDYFQIHKTGQDTSAPLWIAIAVIAVAVTVAMVIAIVLHRRRRAQLKTSSNGSGPTADSHALNNNHDIANKSEHAVDAPTTTTTIDESSETPQTAEYCL